MLITLGLCSAIGAPIASLLMNVLGVSGFYVYMAVCLTVFTTIINIRRSQHVLPQKPEFNEAFIAVAETTTPLAYEMDPRNSEENSQGTVE